MIENKGMIECGERWGKINCEATWRWVCAVALLLYLFCEEWQTRLRLSCSVAGFCRKFEKAVKPNGCA